MVRESIEKTQLKNVSTSMLTMFECGFEKEVICKFMMSAVDTYKLTEESEIELGRLFEGLYITEPDKMEDYL